MLPLATWSTSDQPYSTPPTFIVQDSNDNATWTTVTRSTGSTINVRRYIQLISSFTYTYNAVSPQDAAQYLSNVQFTWAATSGTFTSACHGLGSITSFGNFSTIQDLTTGGNISYNVCTSASSNCSSPTCLVTSANSQITVSTNAYVDFIASFTVTSSTNAPKLDLATIQWYSGTKSPPMASTVWDNRYWLSLATTTSDTFNDAVLTFSSRGIWTIYDIHAGAFTQSKGNLYHADSVASGNVYLDNQGWADNGSPINAFVKSKELSFGNIASDDYLTAIYPTVDNLGNCAVNFSYSTDRSTATYALGSPNQSEFATQSSLRLPFPIDASHQNFGKTFNFTVGTNDAFCPLQYYGFRGYYKDRPVTK